MGQTANKRGVVVPIKPRGARRLRGHVVGFVVGCNERGVLVDYPGNPHGALAARATVSAQTLANGSSAAKRQEVLLVFEQERSDQPVIVGLLDPATSRTPSAAAEAPQTRPVDATVDGRRVVLDAQDEIVLRCGEASITLRRNGRVVIRGAYVETRSGGVNRIKGGSVQIN